MITIPAATVDYPSMRPLPESFQESLRLQLGDDLPLFVASLHDRPPVSIRTHPFKNNGTHRFEPVPWSAFGRYLPARPSFTLDPLFHAGSYYVQEPSSMFLEQALRQTVDLDQPLNVLDLCAAPGGKSTHILSLINRQSLLVSNEVIRSRALILSENIQKWGYPNALITNNDPADFRELPGFFDVMVIDAPCSGEGLFRKDEDAMDEWSPHAVQLCSARQKRILAEAWGALKENGILIYCTCTYNGFENEENLRWLSENYGGEFLPLNTDPTWGVHEVRERGVTGYRFFPHRARGEGFFLSVFRKTASSETLRMKGKGAVARPSKKIQNRLEHWINNFAAATCFQFNDLLFYTPAFREKEVDYLLQRLKIVYAGTNLAAVKHEKLIPAHALALSVEINRNSFPKVQLDEPDALRYLRREAFPLPGNPGFTLVTFNDLPLGWVNILPGRVNNLYPSEWRIRLERQV